MQLSMQTEKATNNRVRRFKLINILSRAISTLSRGTPANYYGTYKGKLRNTKDEATFIRQQCQVIKVKFTIEQAAKSQRGSRGTALLFL